MSVQEPYHARLQQAAMLADRIEHKKSDLVEAAARDAGFPVKVTALEVDLSVKHLQTMHEEVPWVHDGRPYGRIAAIFPYDAPVVVMARLGGGALLTGNQLRFSFSSWTPQTARILADVARPFAPLEALLGQDNREFGRRCVADETVRVLFISGSSAVGETYRRHYKAFDKLFFAGPGGMPAAVVFADADPVLATRFIARRAFINGGQYCTTLKKALIHRSLYEPVRDQLLQRIAELKVGDPFDADTDIGPIRVERTLHILRNALKRCDGASLLAGGIDGEWVHPLVLEMENIPDLELFGPFLALKPFDDPQPAVKELTASRYGFLLSYFGTPPEGALPLIEQHFGMVYDNPDFFFTPLRLPFGGKKDSGWILQRQGDEWVQRDGGFLYSKELVHWD